MSARAALVLGLVAALLVPVHAWPEGPPPRRHVLPNGFRLLVRENPTAGVVQASLQVTAGAAFETPRTNGITNFLQRALIRGTSRRSSRDLAEAAEAIGGSLEAAVDVDHAEVRGSALARHADALLALMAEVVLTPTFPPDEVERERRLILNQIQTRADTPFPFALDTLLRDLYGSHPYALPTAGQRATVEALSRDDLLAHYRAVYHADRLVLAVSGRVDGERVARTVERLFGKLPPGAAGPPAAPAPPAPPGDRRVVDRPVHQAQILVGYLVPSVGSADYAAVKVLGAVLGRVSGRLFAELRGNRGLAYSVGVLSPPRAGPGFLVAHTGTSRAEAETAEAAIVSEIERVRAEGVTETEVDRAKAYILGSLAMDRRTNARHAWYLAFYELVGAGWDFPERYARAVEAVTPAEVWRAAQRYLARPSTVVVRPGR